MNSILYDATTCAVCVFCGIDQLQLQVNVCCHQGSWIVLQLIGTINMRSPFPWWDSDRLLCVAPCRSTPLTYFSPRLGTTGGLSLTAPWRCCGSTATWWERSGYLTPSSATPRRPTPTGSPHPIACCGSGTMVASFTHLGIKKKKPMALFCCCFSEESQFHSAETHRFGDFHSKLSLGWWI